MRTSTAVIWVTVTHSHVKTGYPVSQICLCEHYFHAQSHQPQLEYPAHQSDRVGHSEQRPS